MLPTAKIGRAGELLVQYRLLLLGIDSSPMSTDAGIDLVAYSSTKRLPTTIQVKANLAPKPGGGKGKAALDWWVPEDTPAALVAFVDLSEERVWMLSASQVADLAQQNSSGRHHLYMYTDPTVSPRKTGRPAHVYEFQRYLLENCAHNLFGV